MTCRTTAESSTIMTLMLIAGTSSSSSSSSSWCLLGRQRSHLGRFDLAAPDVAGFDVEDDLAVALAVQAGRDDVDAVRVDELARELAGPAADAGAPVAAEVGEHVAPSEDLGPTLPRGDALAVQP